MKQFFKPTWAKIILMLLVPIYFGYVIEFGSPSATGSTLDIVFQGWRFSPLPYIALFFGAISVILGEERFFAGISQFNPGETVWYFCLEIVLPLVINYLLACVLVFVYRKAFPPRVQVQKPVQPPESIPPEEGMEL